MLMIATIELIVTQKLSTNVKSHNWKKKIRLNFILFKTIYKGSKSTHYNSTIRIFL